MENVDAGNPCCYHLPRVITKNAFFGWSYDIGTSDLGSYHNGSHNIAIGLKIGGKKKRQIRNQNVFDRNLGCASACGPHGIICKGLWPLAGARRR